MKRGRALSLSGGLLAGLAVPRPVGAQSLAAVRVGASLDDGLTPVLYALHAGLFRDHGLDVTLTGSSSGAALAQAVAGGAIDVAKSSLMSVINAYMRGIRFKLIAGAAQYLSVAPTSELCLLKTSPLTSLAQAGGKIVSCNAVQSLDQIGVEALVEKAGGNWQTLKFIEMPATAMLSALEEGRADLAAITNPALQAALASGKVRTLGDPYGGIAARLLIAGWFCTAAFAQQNPTVVQRFGDAVDEAAAYTNAHHDATIQIVADYSHLDPDVIRRMNRVTNATALDPSMIQPAIDAAAHYKMIAASFSAKELLVTPTA